MLISSIPKSGSTALMETLGRVHRLKYTQLTYEELNLAHKPYHKNTRPLWQFHGDLSDLDVNQLSEMVDCAETLYKQHIAPSEYNLNALMDKKIVVLLRQPIQIIESYYRGFSKNIHNPPADFKTSQSMEDWKRYAEDCGLLHALEWWFSSWSAVKNPNWLHVSFEQITNRPQETIAAIENHLSLKPSGTKMLVRARYSKSLFIPYRYNRKWRDRVHRIKAIRFPQGTFRSTVRTIKRKAKYGLRLLIR